MTPSRFDCGGASAAVAASRFGGTPGFSRVMSSLIRFHVLPPSVVLKRYWSLKYSACGSAGEKTSGRVHVWRAGVGRSTSGEIRSIFWVEIVHFSTVPPYTTSGFNGSGAV